MSMVGTFGRRMVVKIGTNTVAAGTTVDTGYVESIAQQIAALRAAGRQVMVVSSGAIGMGAAELGFRDRVSDVQLRQACAAVGQPMLMHAYRNAFARVGTVVAQVLLTAEVLTNRSSYLNLRRAVERLLALDVVPIFNENDCVSTAEIGNAFGDNDRLSALVASKTDADLLVMLSDIDGLYDADPRTNPNAKPIAEVTELTAELRAAAGGAGSRFATGGMASKLRAVRIAQRAGCAVVIAHGREPQVLIKIVERRPPLGTLFHARSRLPNRSRWIMNSRPRGTITIDAGAMAALEHKKSLLPRGVVAVHGAFDRGDVVLVNDRIKLVTAFSSDELLSIRGKHSDEIAGLLGPHRKDVIARPEDMVFVEADD